MEIAIKERRQDAFVESFLTNRIPKITGRQLYCQTKIDSRLLFKIN